MSDSSAVIAETERVSAPNYSPLPVVISRGEGVWVWDVEGRRYLDCISAYSSLNQGHRHPRIVAALVEQAGRLTLTSRAVHNDRMGPFLNELCALAGLDMALPMNTGAEAVETAIKLARKWGYRSKGVAPDRAEIIVCRNNFHGRTTTIVGFSSEEQYREDFGPFTPGFTLIDFGDVDALRAAITPNTVAFLVEPIQAEAGIIMPPPGYLVAARALCREHNVLFVLDEVQTGLGRTGELFAYQRCGVTPDIMALAKALGGGFPVGACLATAEAAKGMTTGTHGSTFGGNPLAMAAAGALLDVMLADGFLEHVRRVSLLLKQRLAEIRDRYPTVIAELRGEGLLVGLRAVVPSAELVDELRAEKMITVASGDNVVRLLPPLIVSEDEIAEAVRRIERACARIAQRQERPQKRGAAG